MIFEGRWSWTPRGPSLLAEERGPSEVYLVEKEKHSPADFSRYLPLIARKSRFCEKKWANFGDEENDTDKFS